MAKRYKQRVEIGRDADGKAIYKWIESNNQQALILTAAQLLIDSGRLTAPPPTLEPVFFKPYTENWMRVYKEGKKKHTTLSEYSSILTHHLYPAFGDRDIRLITIDDVQAFMNGKAKYAAKTIEEMRMLLGMVLEAAREDGIITLNPARSRRLANPSKKAKKRHALTSEQVADIIAHLGDLEKDRDRRFLALTLFTGMRRNEVLGLRWEDIDFDKGLIHVQRGVTFKGNTPIVSTPKTEAGIRIIPLHPQLLEHLSPREASGYILNEDGSPLTQQIVKRMWWRIERTINVYGATPHYFRHTFVTFARRAGVDEKTLQTIGGYADISTMRNIYSHTQAEDVQEASLRISSMFG